MMWLIISIGIVKNEKSSVNELIVSAPV